MSFTTHRELDWQFVSKDEAMGGVYSSEYYAALIFPENFSEDFISVFSGNFTQPKIEYYVNEAFWFRNESHRFSCFQDRDHDR